MLIHTVEPRAHRGPEEASQGDHRQPRQRPRPWRGAELDLVVEALEE